MQSRKKADIYFLFLFSIRGEKDFLRKEAPLFLTDEGLFFYTTSNSVSINAPMNSAATCGTIALP